MGFRYLVIGSGMQGTAGGYALAHWGEADNVIMADLHMDQAEKAADQINSLTGKAIAHPAQVNVKDHGALLSLMQESQAIFSATSYEFNLAITEAAIEAGCHMVDLGGNTPMVFSQLKLSEWAQEKDVSVIPDCGLAPGLGNTFASYGISQLDTCEEVQIRCGGLPQNPKPPLGYKLVFSIKGLTNEYFGKAWVIEDGEVAEVDTFDSLETLEFPKPIGKCEAFTTTGGSSTCPWTFKGKVKTFVYKTVRYPGHYEKFKVMMDLGLLDPEPVEIDGKKVAPRDVFHKVVPSRIAFPEDRDLVVLRTTCKGIKDGKPKTLGFEVIDFFDEKTGFSAMERMTAYPAALVLILSAQGKNEKGVTPLEKALNNELYMKQLPSLGIAVKCL